MRSPISRDELIATTPAAVGNHEFDNPLTVLRQQESGRSFPSSANIYQKVPASVWAVGYFANAR